MLNLLRTLIRIRLRSSCK